MRGRCGLCAGDCGRCAAVHGVRAGVAGIGPVRAIGANMGPVWPFGRALWGRCGRRMVWPCGPASMLGTEKGAFFTVFFHSSILHNWHRLRGNH